MQAHHGPRRARPFVGWTSVFLVGWCALAAALGAQTTAPAPAATANAPAAKAAPKPELRLDDSVVPLAERLRLRLDPTKPDYTGTAEITLRVPAPVSAIRLHAEAMDLSNATVRPIAGGDAIAFEPRPIADGVVEPRRRARSRPASTCSASTSSRSSTRTRSASIASRTPASTTCSRSSRPPTRATASRAGTSPRSRFRGRSTLTVSAGLVAATNAPAAETTVSEAGWTRVRFEETPALPSYLVAIAVGPFDVVEIPGLSVPGRILTPAGQGSLAGLARELAPPLLSGLER